jgi:hypothetical protein
MRNLARLAILVTVCALSGCADGGDATTPMHPAPASGQVSPSQPSALLQACEKVASELDGATPVCPPLIPKGPFSVDLTEVDSKPDQSDFLYTMSFLSRRLPHQSYAGTIPSTSYGHWVFQVSQPSRTVRSGLFQVEPGRVRKGILDGQAVEFVTGVRGPAGINAHHAAVLWRDRRTGYLLSVHGDENLGVAKALAAGIIDKISSEGS